MPDRPQNQLTQSEFIWYQSEELEPQQLRQWLQQVEAALGAHGELYVRQKQQKITYMEVYADVRADVADAIAVLAASEPLFANCARRRETFRRIDRL